MSDEPKKKRGRPRKQVTNETPIIESVKDTKTAIDYSIEHSDEIVFANRLTGEVTHTLELENTNTLNITAYKIQGKTKTMSAMSRQSISYRGNYYTFEYSEERELPISDDINLVKEKESLWYSVNSEVDKQICDMLEFLQNKEKH